MLGEPTIEQHALYQGIEPANLQSTGQKMAVSFLSFQRVRYVFG